jgi:hypothetical protein
MKIYRKDNQGGNGSRLGGLLDSPVNSPRPGLKLIILNLTNSKSGKNDRCITSSFGFSKETMTSRMASSKSNSKSRMLCELGESTTYTGGVG